VSTPQRKSLDLRVLDIWCSRVFGRIIIGRVFVRTGASASSWEIGAIRIVRGFRSGPTHFERTSLYAIYSHSTSPFILSDRRDTRKSFINSNTNFPTNLQIIFKVRVVDYLRVL
jgi:hypothetical protein